MGAGSKQNRAWAGEFGRAYTDRNPQTPEDLDALSMRNFGVSRTALNQEFLGGIGRNIPILEVGANVGAQLAALRQMGFSRLYGVELQFYALQMGKKRHPRTPVVQGSAFDLPFPTGAFELVFTSGVLIHLAPTMLQRAMSEICRCSRRYVWGWEYFAPEHVAIAYRGESGLMWKGDFAAMYAAHQPTMGLVREKRLKYIKNDNVDTMFLLEKKP